MYRGDAEARQRKPAPESTASSRDKTNGSGIGSSSSSSFTRSGFPSGGGVGGGRGVSGTRYVHPSFPFPRDDIPRRESSPPVDAAVIRRIRATSDLYEILGVPSAADEACLKRAYRKLALSLHPDKNDADGAAEAFKSVSNAFAILSDADKRRKYDNWAKANKWRQNNKNNGGNSNNSTTSASAAAASRREAWVKRGTGSANASSSTAKDDSSDDGDDASKFHSDISAEELFNMFFGTGNKSRKEENVHVHRAQHRSQEGDRLGFRGNTIEKKTKKVISSFPYIFLYLFWAAAP